METLRAVFIKFYWDVKFADCLLSKREGVRLGRQSRYEEWLLIAVFYGCNEQVRIVVIKLGVIS